MRTQALAQGAHAHTADAPDTAARLGGDEFVVLVADGDEASGLAQQIVASLATPLPLQGNRVALGVSVGIAIDSAATTPDKLLRDADLAMYAAKEASKGRYAEFHPSLHAKATERLELTALLDTAIQTGSISLFHQPVITAASRLPVGSEALARWKRPGLGFVSPARFIPLAEESGLIRSLTRWAIETGLAHAPTWLQQGLQLAVAVNLSTHELVDPSFADFVVDRLAFALVPPEWLCVEVTEGGLMNDPDRSIETQQHLRGLGIGVSIDDFGTGYSSLAYLKRPAMSSRRLASPHWHHYRQALGGLCNGSLTSPSGTGSRSCGSSSHSESGSAHAGRRRHRLDRSAPSISRGSAWLASDTLCRE